MSKWVRVEVELDLKVGEGETFAGIVRDLMEGMSQGDPDQSRLISLVAREVLDLEPETSHGCRCMDVIG